MSAYADSRTDTRRSHRYMPAYGPVDAVLGYALFYVLVDRATPTVVAVAADVLPGVAPSAIRFATAAALWFILAVTLFDQSRRQLAALGVTTHSQVDPDPNSRTPPSETLALAYLVTLVFAGGVAWLTFDHGIEAAISLLPVVARLDAGAFLTGEFVLVVVFFVSFAIATRSVDRLLVGGVRWLLVDWE